MGRIKKEVKVFPVQEVQLALYLIHLAETTDSKAVVKKAVNSISWANQLAEVADTSQMYHEYNPEDVKMAMILTVQLLFCSLDHSMHKP